MAPVGLPPAVTRTIHNGNAARQVASRRAPGMRQMPIMERNATTKEHRCQSSQATTCPDSTSRTTPWRCRSTGAAPSPSAPPRTGCRPASASTCSTALSARHRMLAATCRCSCFSREAPAGRARGSSRPPRTAGLPRPSSTSAWCCPTSAAPAAASTRAPSPSRGAGTRVRRRTTSSACSRAPSFATSSTSASRSSAAAPGPRSDRATAAFSPSPTSASIRRASPRASRAAASRTCQQAPRTSMHTRSRAWRPRRVPTTPAIRRTRPAWLPSQTALPPVTSRCPTAAPSRRAASRRLAAAWA